MEALRTLAVAVTAVASRATAMAEAEADLVVRGELTDGARALEDFAGTLVLRIEAQS